MNFREFNIYNKFYSQIKCGYFGRVNVRYGIGFSDKETEINRENICASLVCNISNLVSVNQVHGDKILIVDSKMEGPEPDGYDAIITNQKGLFLMIQIADCQSVMLFDPNRMVVANVHNGWRGSSLNLIGKTIDKMRETFGTNPKDIFVAISPSLGPCHAEFSDPASGLPHELHQYIKGNNHVDFWRASIDQCTKKGVAEKHIECANICTVCDKNNYFSFRAEKEKAGRFASVIGII